MARWLNVLYVVIVTGVIITLTWRFATDAPEPSEPLSIGLGWAGLISMTAMLVYIPARRSRWLRRLAPLSMWLNFHIFLGVLGVTCVFFHALHIFTRAWDTYWANPANINFIAVLIVFSSGIFGRYIYSMLPRTERGERMRLEEVRRELHDLQERIPLQLQSLLEAQARPTSFAGVLRADRAARSVLRTLSIAELEPELRRAASRRIYLQRRLTILAGAQRFFRWWILLHRPLSAIMFILSIVHVVVSYMFTSSLATS